MPDMRNKIKEDEKIEKAIRSLLKLPENRRCINCNNLGPQYVCTTFWTFVCTNCCGIHREFTHRVKSVSMAKFTAEEVDALQDGGNERARQFYFKEWDPQRNAYPDSNNLYRLRNFIKNVYVDKKFCGENIGSLSKSRTNNADDLSEGKKVSASSIGSRSPNYGDRAEQSCYERNDATGKGGDRALKFYHDEKRRPHARQSSRPKGLQKSLVRFEIVDDRFRDDGGIRRFDNQSGSHRNSKGSKSLDFSNEKDGSGSPVVLPIRELLGDNVSRLQVSSSHENEESKNGGVPVPNQMEGSSNDTAEQKAKTPESLIDLSNDCEPSDAVAAVKAEQISPSIDSESHLPNEPASAKWTQQTPDANSLEALLFGLSVPFFNNEVNNTEVPSNNNNTSSTASTGENLVTLEDQMSADPNKIGSLVSSAPATHDIFDPQQNTETVVSPNEQQLIVSPSTTQGPPVVSGDVTKPANAILPVAVSEPNQAEIKSLGRKELPADIFSGGHSFCPPQFHGWQFVQTHHMGYYPTQYYPNQMTTGAFPHSAKPANPFDLTSEQSSIQAQFPSMAAMQVALPNVSVQSGYSYSSAMNLRSPTYSVSPGAYTGQQPHTNMSSPGTQGAVGGFSIEANSFNSSMNTRPQASSGYPFPAESNCYSSSGNPFG